MILTASQAAELLGMHVSRVVKQGQARSNANNQVRLLSYPLCVREQCLVVARKGCGRRLERPCTGNADLANYQEKSPAPQEITQRIE